MSEEEINEALKIIKEPITVNSIEYKYFNQENYEKLLSVYENAKWFVSNWEQALQNIKDLQQKVEQLEKENKELKQPQVFIDCENMEERYGRDLYEDYLKEKIEQLENIRKEAIDFVKEHARIDDEYPAYIEMLLEEKQDLLNILNKGE